METKWFNKCYRRNLVDMHIDDWDESFLSQLDAKAYVDLLIKSKVSGAMIYAHSHVGLCNWPTKNGGIHKGLKGKDFIGEVIEFCHREDIFVTVYYSLIYDNWAYENNPSWRIIDVNGRPSRQGEEGRLDFGGRRYGYCCPNSSGYREYVRKQMEDLCGSYEFEGIFFDMTFWPEICYCGHCRERYEVETGNMLPEVVDWSDPNWTAFQKKREEWLTEFAQFATGTVMKIRPGITVVHQFSPIIISWRLGVTEGIGEASDYCSGDFYGGFLQQSFVCKLYNSLTRSKPFEFFTSRCTKLMDHTTMKSEDHLKLTNYMTLANGGACIFIDAIDPVGTLNPKVYDILGNVFGESIHYEQWLGGEMLQDVAIYFSTSSKIDYVDNGKSPVEINSWVDQPHRRAAFNAARVLKENHIPFGVIGRKNLDELDKYKVLVLPNILTLGQDEADRIKEYVYRGGCLYASGKASSEMIGDILGITCRGMLPQSVSYMAPTENGRELMPGVDKKYPLIVFEKQVVVETEDTDSVAATITIPYTDPSDGRCFASIHSNPPGIETRYPAIVSKEYGKGRVIWAAAAFESIDQEPHMKTFAKILRSLAQVPFSFQADCPPAVEITVFHQPENKRYVIHLVNIQEIMPVIPVYDITLKIELCGKAAIKAFTVPDGRELDIACENSYTVVKIPKLDIYTMAVLQF